MIKSRYKTILKEIDVLSEQLESLVPKQVEAHKKLKELKSSNTPFDKGTEEVFMSLYAIETEAHLLNQDLTLHIARLSESYKNIQLMNQEDLTEEEKQKHYTLTSSIANNFVIDNGVIVRDDKHVASILELKKEEILKHMLPIFKDAYEKA